MPETGKIVTALMAKLGGDSSLMTLMPDGVFFGVAPPGKTRFVVVSMTTSDDVLMFGARAFEDLLYLVKAVEKSSQMANAKAAAARIDALLNFQPLTATGYANVLTSRAQAVEYPEVDDVDPSIIWQHAGGQYEVFAA